MSGILPSTVKFSPGIIVQMPGARSAVSYQSQMKALCRHLFGDWGDVCEADKAANDWSLLHGERLVSSYQTGDGVQFYIITEADRSITTVLLPSEY